MTIIETTRRILEGNVRETSLALRAFPKGERGLTPDAVKVSPAYKSAKRAYDTAFAALRAFNGKYPRGR